MSLRLHTGCHCEGCVGLLVGDAWHLVKLCLSCLALEEANKPENKGGKGGDRAELPFWGKVYLMKGNGSRCLVPDHLAVARTVYLRINPYVDNIVSCNSRIRFNVQGSGDTLRHTLQGRMVAHYKESALELAVENGQSSFCSCTNSYECGRGVGTSEQVLRKGCVLLNNSLTGMLKCLFVSLSVSCRRLVPAGTTEKVGEAGLCTTCLLVGEGLGLAA